MADWVAPWATRTVRDGLSARAGLRLFRQAGGKVSDATWSRAVAEARASIGSRERIVGTNLNRRPVSDELTTWTTSKAAGILQQIEVFARDKATGEVFRIPYSHRSETGVRWQRAIDSALNFIAGDSYQGRSRVILGAVPVAAIRMIPEG